MTSSVPRLKWIILKSTVVSVVSSQFERNSDHWTSRGHITLDIVNYATYPLIFDNLTVGTAFSNVLKIAGKLH